MEEWTAGRPGAQGRLDGASVKLSLDVVAALGLSLAACQSEATGPEDPGPEDDGFAVCAAVSFARTSGLPFDEVAVGRLPDDFEEPYAGELLADP